MIELVDVRKKFGKTEVLKGINATFKPGMVNLIIGKSGSGKTVLIKSIVGLIKPTSGEILYNGVDFVIMNIEEKKAIRRELGMLFQGNALFDSKTVLENVRFPLDMFTRESLSEKNEKVNAVLNRVKLINSNNKLPSEISGGMRKRVGIARAIVMNPKYLFCDEPNSGLDPMTSIKIDELISDITDEFNMTTIVVTHDMNSVMGIGEYVMFLHEGLKEWEGDSNSILHSKSQALREFVFASKIMEKLL